MKERQELHCHECNKYVQFDLDLDLDGNHVLTCPNCGHEHCRVVKNGKITEERWSSRNRNLATITVSQATVTTTTTSTYTSYDSTSSNTTDTSSFLYSSWMNTTTG